MKLIIPLILVSLPAFGAATPGDLVRARDWVSLCFPKGVAAAPRPAPGLRIVQASYKIVLNRNAWGAPMTLGDRHFAHGVYMDAPARLHVTLDRPAARFTAFVGIDNNGDTQIGAVKGEGSSTFHVSIGGKEVFASEVMTLRNSPRGIEVPLDGATEFELRVGEAGRRDYDQSDWGDAKVTYQDGTSAYLDDLGFSRQTGPQIPFSFVYGGKPSAQLLPKWERTVDEKTLGDGRTRRTITYRDPTTKLACEATVTLFDAFPAVEWVLSFGNEGDAETPILESINTLDAVWPAVAEDAVTVHRSLGSSALPTDFQPVDEPLADGQSTAFAPSGGRSSNGALPFYAVQWPGGGVCVGVGWSGQWQAQVRRTGSLNLQTGLEGFHATLRPGESVRGPRILMAFYEGNDSQRGSNLYRQVVLRHYMPRADGRLAFPLIAHPSSWDELNNANERNQLDILRAAKKAGLEAYWLDAYWFEGFFPNGVGNWAIPIEQTERRRDYPHGVKPLSDETHRLGMKFVLWFEPERVGPDTNIDRNYSQWVLRVNGQPGGLYNLGDAAAREWMTDYLCRCIEAYKLDVLRIDFNMDPLAYWRAADTPDRQGIAENHYVTGLYRMWDDIIARYPHLFMDNCASGGRRIDLETNMRAIPMWRSDYDDDNVRRGNPIASQGMTMGLTPFMPLSSGPTWRADPYCWRSMNCGGPEAYWDPRKMTPEGQTGSDIPGIAECHAAVKEAQELRPYLLGDFWLLTANSVDPHAWAAWQWHRTADDDGIAMFFRRHESPYPALDVSLRGVIADHKYEVEYRYGYAVDERRVLTGKELQHLRVEIPKKAGSLLIKYRMVRG